MEICCKTQLINKHIYNKPLVFDNNNFSLALPLQDNPSVHQHYPAIFWQ